MKIRKILLLTGIVPFLWGCEELTNGYWDSNHGDDEVAQVIAPAYHGGYLVAGQKYYAYGDNDVADLYLVLYDEGGHIEWTTAYDSDMHNEPLAARETSDHGFLVLTERSTHGDARWIYLLKVDADGHVEWREEVYTDELHRVVDAEATADGGFIMLGYGGPYDAATLLKIDAGGQARFVHTFASDAEPADVTEVDGGFIVLGNLTRGDDESSVELIRTDSWGALLWHRTVWSGGNWKGWHIAEAPDARFYIVGERNSGSSYSTPLVINVDAHGYYLWREDYPEASGSSVHTVVSNWNGLLLAGDMSYGGDHDGFALRADNYGDWMWWRTYGESDDDWIADAVPGNYGGYVLAGTTSSFSEAGDSDFYLVKVDAGGSLVWESAGTH